MKVLMKYLMMAILLLLFTPQAVALDDVCAAGSWYAPERNGEGIVIDVTEKYVAVYFFTHDGNGRDWFLAVGDRSLNKELAEVRLDVYETMLLSNVPYETVEYKVGRAWLDFVDIDNLDFSYELTNDFDAEGGWCLHVFCKGVEFGYVRPSEPIFCGW